MDKKIGQVYPQDPQQPQAGNPPLPRRPEPAAFPQSPVHPQPHRGTTVRWLAAGSLAAGVLCVLDPFGLGWGFLFGPLGIGLAVAALVIGRRSMSLSTGMAITGLVLSAVVFVLSLAQMLFWILLWAWYLWASGSG